MSTKQARKVLNYHLRRAELIQEMGGHCQECGTFLDLEFDHIYGRDWEPRKKARWVRLAIYRREWKLGLVQLLCASCNRRKGSNYEQDMVYVPDGPANGESAEHSDCVPF